MRYVNLPALILSLTLCAPAAATAQAPDARPEAAANAALKYWEALALLPNLDKDQEKLLEEWNTVPLDAAALKLIDRSQGSRLYLHRGAKLAHCDWSLNYEDGIRLLLPHLPKSMTLVRLVGLHARHEFEQGHWKAGWDDVTALLKLARDVEATPIMISSLVGYRIEAMAIEVAAPWLPELKAVLTEEGPVVLDALPPSATVVQLVQKEKQIGPQWLIRELQQAERERAGAWQAVWIEVFNASGDEAEGPVRNAAESAKSFPQAIKLLEDLLPLNDQLAKLAALPWKEFDAQYAEFVRKNAPHPLAGFVLPSLDKFVASQRRCQAQMTLFKAALAIVQGGPDKLKSFQDPFGDGPFEYRPLGNGFELKSKLLVKEQPLTLTVGTGRKESSRRSESANNLKQIALAMHNCHDAVNGFPPPGIADTRAKEGKPLLSWRVAILPYLGQDVLYRQFHLDEPWDSQHNRKLISKMPSVYAAPGISTREPGMTWYQVFVGPGTAFEPLNRGPANIGIPQIDDGTANTLLVVEAGTPVIWTSPEDLPFDPMGKLPKIGGLFAEGINGVFCDGSVRFLRKNIDDAGLRALITRNGGELVDPGDFVRR